MSLYTCTTFSVSWSLDNTNIFSSEVTLERATYYIGNRADDIFLLLKSILNVLWIKCVYDTKCIWRVRKPQIQNIPSRRPKTLPENLYLVVTSRLGNLRTVNMGNEGM